MEAERMIWEKPYTLDDIAVFYGHNKHMGSLIGIEFTEIGPDFLTARMPVDERTHQPFGILHGGASVVLAETLGSVASGLCVDRDIFNCVGIEINASHLRSVKSGWVKGFCTPVRLGRTLHVWNIDLFNEQGKITCTCRLTVAVVKK